MLSAEYLARNIKSSCKNALIDFERKNKRKLVIDSKLLFTACLNSIYQNNKDRSGDFYSSIRYQKDEDKFLSKISIFKSRVFDRSAYFEVLKLPTLDLLTATNINYRFSEERLEVGSLSLYPEDIFKSSNFPILLLGIGVLGLSNLPKNNDPGGLQIFVLG